MSDNYAISYADLSAIESSLSNIGQYISDVNSELDVLSGKQDNIEDRLSLLAQLFSDFIESDAKFKNLQLAETRVGNLRQELQIKFGYYAEIRRMAAGIIQAAEIDLVQNDTIRTTTEEVMLKAPGYWLAPALVGLSSWLRNDKATCEKAVAECLKRDDYKSTLFFMLLTRRVNRIEASLSWLQRYFMHQNPGELDREFITVLEAITTGVFPPASRTVMMEYVKRWLQELTQSDVFVTEQIIQWENFYGANRPAIDKAKYPFLVKLCKNWSVLGDMLRSVSSNEIIYNHFYKIISSGYDSSSSVKNKLDDILLQLVTNFDDEELPLQKQVRLNQLIVEKEGDIKSAEAVMDTEVNIYKEKVDLLQMLTNAAFNPDASGVTRVTQALAVSVSQPWIVEAYDHFTAKYRQLSPTIVTIEIDGYKTDTKDGRDEVKQISDLEEYFKSEKQKAIDQIEFPYMSLIMGAVIGIAGFLISLVFGVLALTIGGIIAWSNYDKYKKKVDTIETLYEEKIIHLKEVLRGCLVEVVDYWKEVKLADSNSEKTRELLNSITPQDYSSISKDTARNII